MRHDKGVYAGRMRRVLGREVGAERSVGDLSEDGSLSNRKVPQHLPTSSRLPRCRLLSLSMSLPLLSLSLYGSGCVCAYVGTCANVCACVYICYLSLLCSAVLCVSVSLCLCLCVHLCLCLWFCLWFCFSTPPCLCLRFCLCLLSMRLFLRLFLHGSCLCVFTRCPFLSSLAHHLAPQSSILLLLLSLLSWLSSRFPSLSLVS